jgi:hypothetical protein
MKTLADLRVNNRFIVNNENGQIEQCTELILLLLKKKYVLDKEQHESVKRHQLEDIRIEISKEQLAELIEHLHKLKKVAENHSELAELVNEAIDETKEI